MAARALFAAETEPEAGTATEFDEWVEELALGAATHRAYCQSYTDGGGADAWRKETERRIYLTGVFLVDVDRWRNVAEDRASTPTEVSNRFEFDYSAWLKPRFRGVLLGNTHCWLFDETVDVDERRERDLDDFRELGHRVVETDWTPAGAL